MATNYGVSCRATSGYVTDPANVTYNLAEAYPVTRGGVTHGWQSGSGIFSVNRSTGVDARLAGINYTDANTTCRFQVDLQETGLHDIYVALGDQNGVHNYSASIYDDTTHLFTICTNTSIAAGSFKDAAGTTHTAANWPGSNVPKSLTFSTTKLVIELTAVASHNVCLAHVFAVYTGGAAADFPFKTPQPQQMLPILAQ